jgi:hypothetical protein
MPVGLVASFHQPSVINFATFTDESDVTMCSSGDVIKLKWCILSLFIRMIVKKHTISTQPHVHTNVTVQFNLYTVLITNLKNNN